jgi:hypothetical protein
MCTFFLKLEKKTQSSSLGNSLVAWGVVQCLALKLGHFQCYCSQCMLAASVIAFISVNFCLCQASCMHHLTSSLCHPFQAAAASSELSWDDCQTCRLLLGGHGEKIQNCPFRQKSRKPLANGNGPNNRFVLHHAVSLGKVRLAKCFPKWGHILISK